MIRSLLSVFGYGVRYRDDRGVFSCRYDSTDFAMDRPIHPDMRVAYPSAKREIFRLSDTQE